MLLSRVDDVIKLAKNYLKEYNISPLAATKIAIYVIEKELYDD